MAAERPLPSFLIFRDPQGRWRWNFAGPGGRILATSSQAYSRSQGCMHAIQLLKGSAKIPVVGREADVQAAKEAAKATAEGAKAEQSEKAEETKKV